MVHSFSLDTVHLEVCMPIVQVKTDLDPSIEVPPLLN